MEVALIAGLLAVAGLVSLILLSKSLGKADALKQRINEELKAHKLFTKLTNEPLPDDEDNIRDLFNDR